MSRFRTRWWRIARSVPRCRGVRWPRSRMGAPRRSGCSATWARTCNGMGRHVGAMRRSNSSRWLRSMWRRASAWCARSHNSRRSHAMVGPGAARVDGCAMHAGSIGLPRSSDPSTATVLLSPVTTMVNMARTIGRPAAVGVRPSTVALTPIALDVNMASTIRHPVSITPLPAAVGRYPATFQVGAARSGFVVRLHRRRRRYSYRGMAIVCIACASGVATSPGQHAQTQDEGKVEKPRL